MRVLLLVDIQNDFCPGGALAVQEGNQVIPVANRLIESGIFSLKIASQDWHPSNHISFFDNHEGRKIFEQIELTQDNNLIRQTLWPRHCEQETAGAKLHAELKVELIDKVIQKGTHSNYDSYSAFFDNNRNSETELRQYLENMAQAYGKSLKDIELYVMGLATDYCVAASARDAVSLGINTSLIVDGCRAVNLNPQDELNTLRELASTGVKLITEREVLAEIKPERVINNNISISC